MNYERRKHTNFETIQETLFFSFFLSFLLHVQTLIFPSVKSPGQLRGICRARPGLLVWMLPLPPQLSVLRQVPRRARPVSAFFHSCETNGNLKLLFVLVSYVAG